MVYKLLKKQIDFRAKSYPNVKSIFLQMFARFRLNVLNKIANDFEKGKFKNQFLEVFLKNNNLYRKKILLFGFRHKKHKSKGNLWVKYTDAFSQSKIQNKTSNLIDLDYIEKEVRIVIICAKKFGKYYASYDWIQFEKYLFQNKIKVFWPEQEEFENKKEFLAKIISFFAQSKKQLLLIEPLASFEVFEVFSKFDLGLVNDIRKYFPTLRVIAQLGDLSRSKDFAQIENVNNFVDAFIHFDQIAAELYPQQILSKMFFYPFFKFGFNRFKPFVNKNKNIFFSGQIRDSDRRLWIRETSKIAKKCNLEFKVNSWGSVENKTRLSEREFSDFMNASLITLGLAQKGKNHWIIPGRSLQAIASESLLLQQEGEECKPIASFLIPFEDYYPFTNISDLENNLFHISKNLDMVSRMTANARQKLDSFFPPEVFWNYCLNS